MIEVAEPFVSCIIMYLKTEPSANKGVTQIRKGAFSHSRSQFDSQYAFFTLSVKYATPTSYTRKVFPQNATSYGRSIDFFTLIHLMEKNIFGRGRSNRKMNEANQET